MKDRILVVQLARLGDLVQTIPFIKDLRNNNREAHITLLCQEKLVSLASMVEELNEVAAFPWNEFSPTSNNPATTLLYLRNGLGSLFQQKYPLVFNLNYSRISALVAEGLCEPQGEVTGNFLAPGGVLKRTPWLDFIGSLSCRRKYNPFNLVDVFRYLIPGKRPELYPLLKLNDENSWNGERPSVVLLLGAGAKKRRWPIFNFIKLAELLQKKTGALIVLAGSKKERGLSKIFNSRSRAESIDLVGKLDLSELCQVLKKACLVIGSDTGPLHLAAALNTRTLGLYFGPAWVHETGPYGAGHLVLQVDLPCGPCLDRNPCRDYLCRKAITPGLVAIKAEEIITGGKLEKPEIPGLLGIYNSRYDGKTTIYVNQVKNANHTAEAEGEVTRMLYRHLAGRFFHFPAPEKLNGDNKNKILPEDIKYGLYCLSYDFLGFSPGSYFEPWVSFIHSYASTREEAREALMTGFNSVFEYLGFQE